MSNPNPPVTVEFAPGVDPLTVPLEASSSPQTAPAQIVTVSDLIDRFPGTTLDTTVWPTSQGAITVSGSACTLPATVQTSLIARLSPMDATEHIIFWEWSHDSDVEFFDGQYIRIGLAGDEGPNRIHFGRFDGVRLAFTVEDYNVLVSDGSTVWNTINHRWCRIRFTQTGMHFETSQNGIAWVDPFGEIPHPTWDLSSVVVRFISQDFTGGGGRDLILHNVNTLGVTGAWVDISDRFVAADLEEGRDDEFEPFPAAPARIILRNEDREFDPEWIGGTFFGKLLPRVPFRIRATSGQHLFLGFVEKGFRQHYQPPLVMTCEVTLVDLLGVLEGLPMPRDAFEAEVITDSAEGYWRMDETEGFVMADSSGNDRHGVFDNGLLGADPLILGHDNCFEVPHTGQHRARFVGSTLPPSFPMTVEAWVRFVRASDQVKVIFAVQRDFTARDPDVTLAVGSASGVDDPYTSLNGELVAVFGGPTGRIVRGRTRIDDDAEHHVVLSLTPAGDVRLYVDGVEEIQTVINDQPITEWEGTRIWSFGNAVDLGLAAGIDGRIGPVAAYSYELSPSRVAQHFEAGASAFRGERSDERVNRVLDFVGVPDDYRDIAIGDTTVGPAIYNSESAGRHLARVAESEQGFLYVDHHDRGALRFRGRYSRFTSDRSREVQVTYSDNAPENGTLKYFTDDLDVDPNGVHSIVNQVEIKWVRGTTTVRDVESTSKFGPQSRQLTTMAPNQAAAQSAGRWLVKGYADPQTRVRKFAPVLPDAAGFPVALGLRVSDRIAFERRPQRRAFTDVLRNELFVEGVSHSVIVGRWRTVCRVSSADIGEAWIWNASRWGEDTRWG